MKNAKIIIKKLIFRNLVEHTRACLDKQFLAVNLGTISNVDCKN